MPIWLWPIIQLAIKLGSPIILKAIFKKIENKYPIIAKIIKDVLDGFDDPDTDNSEVKKDGLNKLKECRGLACPPKVKSDN